MMMLLRLLPVVLSALLLAAHFFRNGRGGLTLLCLAVSLSLAIRRPWVMGTARVFLALAALEWLRTLVTLAHVRAAHGEPWARLAVILGSVTLFTVASALVFRSAKVRAYFRGDSAAGPGPDAVAGEQTSARP